MDIVFFLSCKMYKDPGEYVRWKLSSQDNTYENTCAKTVTENQTEFRWFWKNKTSIILSRKGQITLFFDRVLKAVDTIGNNCQRLVLTVGVSQHMHTITNLWKLQLNRSSKLRDNNERKNTRHMKLCRKHQKCLISRPQILNLSSWN